jgi:hypothetical protein
MARTPDSAALLDAWEAALSEPGDIRAPSLLASLGWVDTPEALAATTIGQTDRLLFALRIMLFGATLDCVAVCPSCAELLEFTVAAADIVPPAPAGAAECVGLLDGLLECRPPVNSDVAELAGGSGPVGSRQLLAHCVLRGRVALAQLSEADCDRALRQLAEADPCSCIEMAIDCACGHRWTDEFDIRSYLLTELTDWAAGTLRDVHRLASRYGWSEVEILRMSPWRKRIYLDACEAGP